MSISGSDQIRIIINGIEQRLFQEEVIILKVLCCSLFALPARTIAYLANLDVDKTEQKLKEYCEFRLCQAYKESKSKIVVYRLSDHQEYLWQQVMTLLKTGDEEKYCYVCPPAARRDFPLDAKNMYCQNMRKMVRCLLEFINNDKYEFKYPNIKTPYKPNAWTPNDTGFLDMVAKSDFSLYLIDFPGDLGRRALNIPASNLFFTGALTDEIASKIFDSSNVYIEDKYCLRYHMALIQFFKTGKLEELVVSEKISYYNFLLSTIRLTYEGKFKDAIKSFDEARGLMPSPYYSSYWGAPGKPLLSKDDFANVCYIVSLAMEYKKSDINKLLKISEADEFLNSAVIAKILLEYKNPSVQIRCSNVRSARSTLFSTPASSIALLPIIQKFNIDLCSDNHFIRPNLTKEELNEEYTIAEGFIQMLDLRFIKRTFASIKGENIVPDEDMVSSLLDNFTIKPKWQSMIELMINSVPSSNSSKNKKAKSICQETERIIYRLKTDYDGEYILVPVKQKSKNGGASWTKGQEMSISSFIKSDSNKDRIDIDLTSVAASSKYDWDVKISFQKAAKYLIGSDKVVLEGKSPVPVDITELQPQIIVSNTKSGFTVKNNLPLKKDEDLDIQNLFESSPTSFSYTELTNVQLTILENLQSYPSFPLEAKDSLVKLLEAISPHITVLSDLLQNSENLERVESNSILSMKIVPIGEDFIATLLAKPLGTVPPYFAPGKGNEHITGIVDANNVMTTRDLKAENNNLKQILTITEKYEESDRNDYEWILDTEECLTTIDSIREINASSESTICNIEWPEGVKLKVNLPAITSSDFRMSVHGKGYWFEMVGGVKLPNGDEIALAQLLNSLSKSEGKFINIGDEEYIRISAELHKQLETLQKLTVDNKKKSELSSFNISAIQELENIGVNVESDNSYKKLCKRIKEADEKKFHTPKGLQAELRDYQTDGFEWMMRLAHWGAGACLADDMGLGKTLQSISVMLAKAKEGATLVVVPTSVVLNWKSEIQRFAPQLNVFTLPNNKDERKMIVEDAKEFDIIIATYGLLVTEESLLTAKDWNIVVLDEAHTIKNRDTKMSKSAMKLKGEFRLMLTGTPIQNNLSEIWNLFQFANPSLLGSYQQFTDKFISPIEVDHNKDQQRLLKKILSPFLLRRTKSDVINELPQKTEITHQVELSKEETIFYESLRSQAQAAAENGELNAMQTLAEITKLRQAACNPRLVDENVNIQSSKTEAFLNLVNDLINNGHRSLVFSQFTSHLALIKEALDKEKIEYLYLDGACSASERAKLVDKFQKGDMPLFLISLKAGGTGLNLTAADYVIHLDPWWNPAIEDQASDRAYRIGQQRPVTVYRLIATGTIEEKIIRLHQNKKSLADALLEGSDVSARLSREEMLELIGMYK